MKEIFKDVEAGQPISAAEYNRRGQLLNRLANEGRGDGVDGIDAGGVRAKNTNPRDILFVRITAVTVPQSSALYVATNNFNAAVLVWDEGTNAWVDDAAGAQVAVVPLRDGQGFLPLEAGRKIAVRYNTTVGAYVPLETPDVAVVVPTSASLDADGMQDGKRIMYDSDAKKWVTLEDIYVLRIGT